MCESYQEYPVKIGVSVPYSGTVRDLRSIVSKTINVAAEQLILSQAYDDGDHCSLHDESMIDAIPEVDDCLFALEAPSQDEVKYLPGSKPNCKTDACTVAAEHFKPDEGKSPVDGLAANFRQRVKSCATKEEKNTIVVVVTNVELKDRRTRRYPFLVYTSIL